MQRALFVGGFACGKRTLANALLRKKVLHGPIGTSGIIANFVTEIVSGNCARAFSVNKDSSKKQQFAAKQRAMEQRK